MHCLPCRDPGNRCNGHQPYPPSKKLCFSCHTESSEKVLHGPYSQGNCIVCHSPHSSDQPNQLLAPTQELCMGCHLRSRLKVDAKHRTAKVPWGVTLSLDQLKGLEFPRIAQQWPKHTMKDTPSYRCRPESFRHRTHCPATLKRSLEEISSVSFLPSTSLLLRHPQSYLSPTSLLFALERSPRRYQRHDRISECKL